MAEKRRLNLSFSLASPQQREAWNILRSIPTGRRTDAVCRMVCKAHEQEGSAVRYPGGLFVKSCRGWIYLLWKKEEHPQAGDVDESVLGFLRALQEGDDMT